MILTDDNLCSIMATVGEGIYVSIQKCIAFVVSMHVAEVMQVFFALGWDSAPWQLLLPLGRHGGRSCDLREHPEVCRLHRVDERG